MTASRSASRQPLQRGRDGCTRICRLVRDGARQQFDLAAQRMDLVDQADHRLDRIVVEPEIVEVIEGKAEVRTVFTVGRRAAIAGSQVIEGKAMRNAMARVLRRGKVVGEVSPTATTESQIAEMMVGRPVQLVANKASREPGAVMLAVEGLQVVDPDGRAVVDGVSFVVRAGEIVGIAGVQGNGQTELVDAITGLRAAASGTITVLERHRGRDLDLGMVRSMHPRPQRPGRRKRLLTTGPAMARTCRAPPNVRPTR